MKYYLENVVRWLRREFLRDCRLSVIKDGDFDTEKEVIYGYCSIESFGEYKNYVSSLPIVDEVDEENSEDDDNIHDDSWVEDNN